ncbi:MAG: ABC transporter permease [Phycisphaerales bacterium]
MLASLIRHRGYVWGAAAADLRNRYAGSIGGALWNVLQPLLMIAVFTVVFTSIMARPGGAGVVGDAPYVVYLCAALLPWYALAECVTRGTHALAANALYLRKSAIPEQVFVAQTAVAAAMSLTVSFTLLILVALAFGHQPAWTWLLLPVPLALLLAMGFGLAVALASVFVFIRDVGQAVPVLLQAGFWTFPIVYHAEQLPGWALRLLPYNPMYPALTGVRELFLFGRVPGVELWAGMILWAAAALLLGSLVLRKLRPEIRDVI